MPMISNLIIEYGPSPSSGVFEMGANGIARAKWPFQKWQVVFSTASHYQELQVCHFSFVSKAYEYAKTYETRSVFCCSLATTLLMVFIITPKANYIGEAINL